MALAVDGKTLRGTIPLRASQGVHLLAAYLPEQGVVLAAVASGWACQRDWPCALPAQAVGSAGVIVTEDAMLAQRKLRMHIVQAAGDYLWIVKGNQG